jgi:hypothetical protein
MDPKSTYLLEIKLLGNPKKVRKDVRYFCFDKVVDSDTTNLKNLVDEITDMYPPGYLEVAHVQYYDADLKSFPVVNTGQELMLMFQKHINSKVVHMFIAYSDHQDAMSLSLSGRVILIIAINFLSLSQPYLAAAHKQMRKLLQKTQSPGMNMLLLMRRICI